MSTEITPNAYRTKLGNLPAKSVLGLLADQVNADGYGWPSVEYIADRTEINLRTVLRVVQVFVAIGLVEKVDRGRHRTPGMQLNLTLLGSDLRKQFADAYAIAQRKRGKAASGECLTDTAADVCETPGSVSETLFDVSQTFPPDPLIGGTAKEPLKTHTPPTPSQGEGELFDEEQLAHLERVRPEDRARWERYYRECNECEAAKRAEQSERETAARAEFGTRTAAIAAVMRGCSWQAGVRRNPVPALIGQVLDAEAAVGAPLWRTGPRLIAAWDAQRASPREAKYGSVKFLRDGHWREYVTRERCDLAGLRMAQEEAVR